MMNTLQHSKGRQRQEKFKTKGQSLVEFAMVIPLFLLFIFGAFDLGRLFYYKIVFTNAAREGAHYFFANPKDQFNGFADTIAVVLEEADKSDVDFIAPEDITIVCLDEGIPLSGCPRGATVSVTVSQDIPLGLIGLFIQTPTITGKANMLIP
jgi:uncharacterized protein (DUF427 family)